MTDGGEDTFFASGFASAGLVERAFAAATLGSGLASSRRRGVVSSFFSSSFDSFASDATTPKTSFAGPRPVLSPSQRHAFPSAASTAGAQVASNGRRAPFTTRRDRGCQGSPTRSYRVPLRPIGNGGPNMVMYCLLIARLPMYCLPKNLLVLPEMRAIRGRDRGLPETLRTEVVLTNRRVAAAFTSLYAPVARCYEPARFASASFHAVEVPTDECASAAGTHAG